jgi:peptide/nickel transport system permease protein
MLARMIVRRMGLSVAILVLVSAIIFLSTSILPGDVAERVLGRESSDQQRQELRERLLLDRPLVERYSVWLGGAVTGDFGRSLVNQQKVSASIKPAGLNTLFLAGYAFVLYLIVTVIAAIAAAVFRDRAADLAISILTLLSLSLPEFMIGTLLILALAVEMPIFPALAFVLPGASFGYKLYALALPALTLTMVMAAHAIRLLRDNLIEVLGSEYVRMATLKGVPRSLVILRHALPNALGPALNVTSLNLTYLIGGVVVVEEVFAYPGLGKLLVDSISLRDVPMVEAIALLASAVYIGANLIADIIGIVVNPRLRSG